jgi:hypothetical protein
MAKGKDDPHARMLERVEGENNIVREWDGWARKATTALRLNGTFQWLGSHVMVKGLPHSHAIEVTLHGEDAEAWLREHGIEPKPGGQSFGRVDWLGKKDW